jgi:hypothetical protein
MLERDRERLPRRLECRTGEAALQAGAQSGHCVQAARSNSVANALVAQLVGSRPHIEINSHISSTYVSRSIQSSKWHIEGMCTRCPCLTSLLACFLPTGTQHSRWHPGEDVRQIATSKQVLQYLGRYGQVLVTNYRDFVLVGRDADTKPVILETYQLAESESSFWNTATNPRKMAGAHSQQFTEYLKRVMLHAAPLAKPEDVAWFLASYARDAKYRIEKIDLPALATFRSALEEALGIKFEGKKGEHFFRSTLVQTLFYGIFSAWVLWSKQYGDTHPQANFNWREAVWYLHVPMIKALFEQVATPTKLGPLGLVEVLDWTGTALNRVDRSAFFSRFEEDHAVQYFYEPFLEAFDPELRKDLGVWYTPQEIVQYMVARVDAVLREELEIEDGLADPRVYILDPCCGTGTYLIEVLKRIAATFQEKGEDALGGYDIKKAAMERIFGFELLPAPFVVAHLQLGLLLQHFGTPLSDEKNERAGVYLTNSLTGWEPPDPAKEKIVQLHLAGMPELKEERDAAEQIKRNVPILVILGNPPYNAFAGVSTKEEHGLVDLYKAGLISEWGIKKFNLDDLYVRFFRLAEHRIVDGLGKGVVCYISNFSYLGDPSYVVMRQRFLGEFDKLWFDSLNGDSRETGKLTPDGKPDPSIFSTEHNREGIRLGTSIGLMVRETKREARPTVSFRQFWGVTKRTDLLESLQCKDFNAQYETVVPDRRLRYSFRPLVITEDYLTWPKVVELCEEAPISGLQEMRRGALMDIDRDALEERMRLYLNPSVDWSTFQKAGGGLAENSGGFDARSARTKLQASEKYDSNCVMRYALYPFDVRWCYYSVTPPLWNRPRPLLKAQNWQGNSFFVTRMMAERPNEQVPIIVTSVLPDYHLLRPNIAAIPIRLQPAVTKKAKPDAQDYLFDTANEPEVSYIANLSRKARAYLNLLGLDNPDFDADIAGLIWMHALAVGYSPAYLIENADGIRQDWPRVVLPNKQGLLLASAELGRKMATLLDTERSVPNITSGKIRPELRSIAVISHIDGGALNPLSGDLAVTASWGHGGNGSIIMPGKGKIVERDYTSEERAALKEGAETLGLSLEETIEHLGEGTCDIYLNNIAYWKNVPRKVWDYHIGGYQVIKKWLSYREYELLGRALTVEEVREVMNIARRISAILLLEPVLDANYQAIKNSTYAWPTRED